MCGALKRRGGFRVDLFMFATKGVSVSGNGGDDVHVFVESGLVVVLINEVHFFFFFRGG